MTAAVPVVVALRALHDVQEALACDPPGLTSSELAKLTDLGRAIARRGYALADLARAEAARRELTPAEG